MIDKLFTVKATTTDGSIWLLDDEWVRELWSESQAATASAFHDYLVDTLHSEDNATWLYPNARLLQPSSEASRLFDLGDSWFEDTTDDNGEPTEPYGNGWQRASFEVTVATAAN
jgi:hypothetical protein